MADAGEILEAVKRAALDAVESGKPAALLFGTVESADPLRIRLDQKLTLDGSFLLLSRAVTDREETLVLDGTERAATVKGGLKAGESVLLLRMQGGQRFAVLDRVIPGKE